MKQPPVSTISAATFFVELGRRAAAKELDRPTYSNPVRAFAAFIGENSNAAESRLLVRIFRAVVRGSGEFREAEVYSLMRGASSSRTC